MEIILIDGKNFGLPRSPSSDNTFLTIQLNVNEQSLLVGGSSSHQEYRQKVVAASTHFDEANSHSICIHVKKNPANPEDFTKCLVRLCGFLEENLTCLWVKGLKVRIQLSCLAYSKSEGVGFRSYPATFSAEIPMDLASSSAATNSSIKPGKEGCIKNRRFSEVKDVPTHNWKYVFKDFNSGLSTTILGCVTVSLVSNYNPLINFGNDQQLALVNIEEQGLARVCKKILDSKIHLDVTIAAKDGTVFDCNKSFLAAQSKVLEVMLETDMKEAKTSQIEMKDMSAIGVKALLEYIYTLDLGQAFENCDIALDLLQAGHKYDITTLEKEVFLIILKKDVEWFSVDMAFSLFVFARKVDSMEDLKLKAVSLLMSKSNEVMDCEAYKSLSQENPGQSSAAVLELFCLSQSHAK